MVRERDVTEAFEQDRDDQYVRLLEYALSVDERERKGICGSVWSITDEHEDSESPTWIVWDGDDERIREALEEARADLAWLRRYH